MGHSWWCPAHDGRIDDYRLVGKQTKGQWWLKIRCACGAVLVVTKHGIRLVNQPPTPSKAPSPSRWPLMPPPKRQTA